ncbi:restriction endonuclease subunit S [Mesorhizobium sp. M1050]|uniref:restriction endonuclease subunit S n=1 Tax=Mesorhizobium sp. M1050 TaxID=2957051 RepID=UPI00333567AC
MTGLPRGWVEYEASEICDLVQSGGTPKEGFIDRPGVPFLKVYNIVGQKIDFEYRPQFINVDIHHSSMAKSQAFPGDVLMNIVGPPLGKVAVVPDTYPTWNVNQALTIFRPNASITSEWLYYFLCGGDSVKSVINETRGSAGQVNISLSQCRSFKLPLPPLAEQKRIVAKLDALNAKSARARTELARVEILVSRYRQVVLRSAFLGRMTSEWRAKKINLQAASALIASTPTPHQPRGGREATDRAIQGKAALAVNTSTRQAPPKWQWVPLNRITRQETGHTPSRSHPEWWGGDIPWIGIKDAGAHHGKVIEHTIQTTNKEGLANSAARLLPAGTVCLSRTASVGYVTIMGKPMATSQDFVTWTCTEALVPKFLMYALIAEGEDIREFGKGTTHTTIYFPEVRAMQICLAPLEEQHEIVRRIESAFARIDRLAGEAKRALELVGRLDEAILAKAFRGVLVPQVENDEPAERLLARIRAERAAEAKEKPKPFRRKSAMLTAREFLKENMQNWPEEGVSFQDLRGEFRGNYDDLKEAVFASISDDKPTLQQVFDETRSLMMLRKHRR